MQTEFREKTRQQAETISAETNNLLRTEYLAREIEIEKIRREVNHELQVFNQEQDIGLKRLEGQLFEQETLINVKNSELSLQNQLLAQELVNNKRTRSIELEGTHKTFLNTLEINKEKQNQDLNKVKFESQTIQKTHEQAKEKLGKEQELKHIQEELELKSQYYTGNVLKGELIKTVANIYNHMTVKEYRVVNTSSDNN
jgi:hypothetical protein